jgi:hypothetical protein
VDGESELQRRSDRRERRGRHSPQPIADPAITRYQLYTGVAENNNFQFVGYGQRGSNGAGVSCRRRLRLATAAPATTCSTSRSATPAGATSGRIRSLPRTHVLLTDFDNGTTGVQLERRHVLDRPLQQLPNAWHTECNAGRGLDEAISGGGDSGGPGFINGQIASVTSFGLTFGQQGTGFGDIDNSLNSSFGEYAGFTDVAFQSQWINSQLVRLLSRHRCPDGDGLDRHRGHRSPSPEQEGLALACGSRQAGRLPSGSRPALHICPIDSPPTLRDSPT